MFHILILLFVLQSYGQSSVLRDITKVKMPPSFADQTVYVNKGGSDFAGNGDLDKPYLTIQRAMQSIVDNSQTKVYHVHVGPGTYSDPFALKPWVGVVGEPATSGFEGVTSIGTVVTLDPSWAGTVYDVSWLSFLTFNPTQLFNITNVDGQLTFFDCLFNAGASFVAHHSGNVNNIVLDNCLSYGTISVTDCQYLFLIGGTVIYDGGVTVQSTNAVYPTQTTLLATGGHISDNVQLISGVGSGGAVGDMRGCSVTGSLTLTGGVTTYTASAEGIPNSITLSGGASPPVLYTKAPAIGYTPSVPGNWAGSPTTTQQAIDRLAAFVSAGFGMPIP